MEFKAIAYIILGIVYAIYSIKKKMDEQKQTPKPVTQQTKPNPNAKSVEDILREMQKSIEQAKATKRNPEPRPQSKPVVKTVAQRKKEIMLEERKPTTVLEEGKSNYASVYERPLTDEEKMHDEIERAMKNKSLDDFAPEPEYFYQFDARQAFIGSLIFERKF